jgi:DNA-binding transcriptional ArsR family regulator
MISAKALKEKALILNAMGNEKRLRILLKLCENKCFTVNSLVEELALPQATVSQHLRILRLARIIHGVRDNKTVCYTIINDQVRHILDNCLDRK